MSEFKFTTPADPATKLRPTSDTDASKSGLGAISDSFSPVVAEEASILNPALDILPLREKYLSSKRFSILDSVKLTVSIALSFLVGSATMSVVSAEYHYGYEVVQRLLGKTEVSVQWIFSIGLFLLCGLFGFALTFGFLKSHFRGSIHWNFAAIPMLLACMLLTDTVTGLRLSLDLDYLIPLMIVGLLSLPGFLCVSMFGSKFWGALSRRVDPARIFGPGIVAIVCICFLSVLSTSWRFEIAKDAVGIFAAALASATLVRREELSSKIVAAMLCCLPFLLFDLVNVAFNLALLSVSVGFNMPDLWDDGNRALLSSLFILFVCLGGIMSGATVSRLLHTSQKHVSARPS